MTIMHRDQRAGIASCPDTALRDAALALAGEGWHVFRCHPDGAVDPHGDPISKRPAVTGWEGRAATDPEMIRREWRRGRRGNIGVACLGQLVAVDLDLPKGEWPKKWLAWRGKPGILDGRDVLADYCEARGQPWPYTRTIRTPSGGWHLWFTALPGCEIRNSTAKLGPMIDIRGAGGYVLGPGSIIDGAAYEVIDDDPPVPLPQWIADLDREMSAPPPRPAAGTGPPGMPVSKRARALIDRVLQETQVGERNTILFWAARKFRELVEAGECSPEQVMGALVEAAAAIGLKEGEARGTVASALRGPGGSR